MPETNSSFDLVETELLADLRARRSAAMRTLPAPSSSGASRIPSGQISLEVPRATYREFAPPPSLREHVVCFWSRTGDAVADGGQIVLPDGCIDIVWAGELPPFIAGPMTVSLMPAMNSGADIIGVRFRPGAAPSLLGVGANELRDRRVPLSDLWPGGQALLWSDAAEIARDAGTLDSIAAVIANHAGAAEPPDPLVTDAACWMANHPWGRLSELTPLSGLSERQIRRRFDEAIGYGPKKLQRILRLQRLLWLASQKRGAPLHLSALAFAAGYADQPHMTREVTALSGKSPGQLLLSAPQSAVSEMFKTATS